MIDRNLTCQTGSIFKVYLYRLHMLGSVDLCEGLTSISQQLVLNTFEIFIAETLYNLPLLNLLLLCGSWQEFTQLIL